MQTIIKFFAISLLGSFGFIIQGMDHQKNILNCATNSLEILPSEIWGTILQLSFYQDHLVKDLKKTYPDDIYEGLEKCLIKLFEHYKGLKLVCQKFNNLLLNLNSNPLFKKGIEHFYSKELSYNYLIEDQMLQHFVPKKEEWHRNSLLHEKIAHFIFQSTYDVIPPNENKGILYHLARETLLAQDNTINVKALEKLINLLIFYGANCEKQNSIILMVPLFFNPENLTLISTLIANKADVKITLLDEAKENQLTCLSALYLGLVSKFNRDYKRFIFSRYQLPPAQAMPMQFFHIPEMKKNSNKHVVWWEGRTEEEAQEIVLLYAKTKYHLNQLSSKDIYFIGKCIIPLINFAVILYVIVYTVL